MKQFLMVVLIALMAAVMMSCGSHTQQGVALEQSGYQAIYEPVWWDSCQTNEEYLCQRATGESKDQQVSANKAAEQARAGLQLQVEDKLEVLTKNFAEEAGLGEDADFTALYTQTSKQVASGVLQATVPWREETRKDKETNLYRSWTIYRLILNDAYLANLKAVKANKHLWDRFRAGEAFQEHEKEMEKYEQYKKEHGL